MAADQSEFRIFLCDLLRYRNVTVLPVIPSGMEQHLSFFRNLDLPEEISRKFFAENAKRIYLVPDGERDPEIT